MERVPENVDAAKELLQYGLKGTDLEALLAIGKGADDGRLVTERFGFKSEGDFVKTFKTETLGRVNFALLRLLCNGAVDLTNAFFNLRSQFSFF